MRIDLTLVLFQLGIQPIRFTRHKLPFLNIPLRWQSCDFASARVEFVLYSLDGLLNSAPRHSGVRHVLGTRLHQVCFYRAVPVCTTTTLVPQVWGFTMSLDHDTASTAETFVTPIPIRHSMVLVVDQDAKAIDQVSKQPEGAGVRVLQANTGMQGYWLAISKDPDAIITELGLPNGGGADMLECLKDNP